MVVGTSDVDPRSWCCAPRYLIVKHWFPHLDPFSHTLIKNDDPTARLGQIPESLVNGWFPLVQFFGSLVLITLKQMFGIGMDRFKKAMQMSNVRKRWLMIIGDYIILCMLPNSLGMIRIHYQNPAKIVWTVCDQISRTMVLEAWHTKLTTHNVESPYIIYSLSKHVGKQ